MAEIADIPESWPVVTSGDLYRDDWVMALRSDRIRRPGAVDEEPFARLVFEHPGAVMVLAVDDRDRACVLQQYRHPVQMRLVELPAGLCDVDREDPLETARRELREEVQLEAATWEHLLTTYTSPGFTSERLEIYLAKDLAPAGRGDFTLAHEEADMSVSWVPVEALVDAVLERRVTDGPTVAAVLAYAVRSRKPG